MSDNSDGSSDALEFQPSRFIGINQPLVSSDESPEIRNKQNICGGSDSSSEGSFGTDSDNDITKIKTDEIPNWEEELEVVPWHSFQQSTEEEEEEVVNKKTAAHPIPYRQPSIESNCSYSSRESGSDSEVTCRRKRFKKRALKLRVVPKGTPTSTRCQSPDSSESGSDGSRKRKVIIKKVPFCPVRPSIPNGIMIDGSFYHAIIRTSKDIFDARGNLIASLRKNAIPQSAINSSIPILSKSVSVWNSRQALNNGVPPLSGILGYYDYLKTPFENKCRKTAFTRMYVDEFSELNELIESVDFAFKSCDPKKYISQHRAVPDIVRLHESAFSTITVNDTFRTSTHTDKGDYDDGMGVLAVIQGTFKGCHLGFPEHGFCLDIQPGDVVVFDTHQKHCNTEPELPDSDNWSRLSCVFYYRYHLGDDQCLGVYKDLVKKHNKPNLEVMIPDSHWNGINTNLPRSVFPTLLSPSYLLSQILLDSENKTISYEQLSFIDVLLGYKAASALLYYHVTCNNNITEEISVGNEVENEDTETDLMEVTNKNSTTDGYTAVSSCDDSDITFVGSRPGKKRSPMVKRSPKIPYIKRYRVKKQPHRARRAVAHAREQPYAPLGGYTPRVIAAEECDFQTERRLADDFMPKNFIKSMSIKCDSQVSKLKFSLSWWDQRSQEIPTSLKARADRCADHCKLFYNDYNVPVNIIISNNPLPRHIPLILKRAVLVLSSCPPSLLIMKIATPCTTIGLLPFIELLQSSGFIHLFDVKDHQPSGNTIIVSAVSLLGR